MSRSVSDCWNAVRWLMKDDAGARMEFVLLAAIVAALAVLVYLALRRLDWTTT